MKRSLVRYLFLALLTVVLTGMVSAQSVVDDFNDCDIGEYSGYTDVFTTSGSTVFEGSCSLEATKNNRMIYTNNFNMLSLIHI